METKKISRMALLTALAMIFSFVESQIPSFVAIPGVKVGLANIVVVFALYMLGAKEAFMISIIRVVLSSLLFGSVLSLSYSLAGAILSLLGMVLLKKTGWLGPLAVSVTGGVLHNCGQIAVASLVLETDVLLYYLPVLMIAGILTGCVIGIAAALVLKRLGSAVK